MEEQIGNIDNKVLKFRARIFNVLGDANRIKIMELLRDGEKCQCEIIPYLRQSQPTISRHLSLLEEAGLIRSRRDGKKELYRATDEQVYKLIDALDYELMRFLSSGLMSKLFR